MLVCFSIYKNVEIQLVKNQTNKQKNSLIYKLEKKFICEGM